MLKPKKLKKGDKVAIVSLSSGTLGEDFCAHNVTIGSRRLKEMGLKPVFMPHALKGIEYVKAHPEKRAEDLKAAFLDDEIKGIICAIGGDDTYRTLPYLMEDEEFVTAVKKHPKIFTGFSDTTVNHLMFHRLGMQSFYGPNFLCDLGDMGKEMLPYTKAAFQSFFEGCGLKEITPSPVWYEERNDFSAVLAGTDRVSHEEKRGFELLQGVEKFRGELLGGCLETLFDVLTANRHPDERVEICEKYCIFPSEEEWKGKILFVETCEEKPATERFREELLALKERGVFGAVSGILVGKPQDEVFYEEYKEIWREVVDDSDLPILYNVNFGHAYPRTVLPYGTVAEVYAKAQKITIL